MKEEKVYKVTNSWKKKCHLDMRSVRWKIDKMIEANIMTIKQSKKFMEDLVDWFYYSCNEPWDKHIENIVIGLSSKLLSMFCFELKRKSIYEAVIVKLEKEHDDRRSQDDALQVQFYDMLRNFLIENREDITNS